MADAVALVSVLTSGGVAAASVVYNFVNGRQQRKHEAGLAFEQRIWEEKRTVLIDVMTQCRILLFGLDRDDGNAVMSVAEARHDIGLLGGGVEAYASKACRDQFTKVQDILGRFSVDVLAQWQVEGAREEKENAIEAQDFERAARARATEKDALKAMLASLAAPLDRKLLRTEVGRLMEESRESLRHSD